MSVAEAPSAARDHDHPCFREAKSPPGPRREVRVTATCRPRANREPAPQVGRSRWWARTGPWRARGAIPARGVDGTSAEIREGTPGGAVLDSASGIRAASQCRQVERDSRPRNPKAPPGGLPIMHPEPGSHLPTSPASAAVATPQSARAACARRVHRGPFMLGTTRARHARNALCCKGFWPCTRWLVRCSSAYESDLRAVGSASVCHERVSGSPLRARVPRRPLRGG